MDPTCPPAQESRHRGALTGALLAALACGVYLNTLGHGFVHDDVAQILTRVASRDFLSLHTIFATDHFGGQRGGYRPLVALSFALNYLIGGRDPLTYHALNVLLHAAVTVLVYLVVRRLFAREVLAVVTAALFAVHPIHTEAVAWVSGRADLLAALFFLSAWVLYVRASWSSTISLAPFFASLIAFSLALMSKEHALLFPAILVLTDVFREWNRGGKGRASLSAMLSKRWWLYLSYLLLIGLYLALRYSLFGRALLYEPSETLDVRNPLRSVPWYPRVLTAARILVADLGLLVWPSRLSVDYSYNQIPLSMVLFEPGVMLALCVLLVFVLAAVILAWKGSIEGFGLMFYLTMIAATANVLTVTHTIRAERLLYLPSLGICLAAAGVTDRFAHRLSMGRRKGRTTLLMVGVAAVCVALAARTVVRNQDWKDHYTLWRSAVRVVPANAVARYAFGLSLADRGQVDDAIGEYVEALGIYPAYREARMALGNALVRKGQEKQGLRLLREVVSEKPSGPEGHVWLGEGLAKAGLLDESVASFQEALRLRPDHALTHYLLGSVYLRQGEVEKAIASYRNALMLSPESPVFLTSLGYAYIKHGEREEARTALEHALRLTPDSPQARAVLSMLDHPGTLSPLPEPDQK